MFQAELPPAPPESLITQELGGENTLVKLNPDLLITQNLHGDDRWWIDRLNQVIFMTFLSHCVIFLVQSVIFLVMCPIFLVIKTSYLTMPRLVQNKYFWNKFTYRLQWWKKDLGGFMINLSFLTKRGTIKISKTDYCQTPTTNFNLNFN